MLTNMLAIWVVETVCNHPRARPPLEPCHRRALLSAHAAADRYSFRLDGGPVVSLVSPPLVSGGTAITTISTHPKHGTSILASGSRTYGCSISPSVS